MLTAGAVATAGVLATAGAADPCTTVVAVGETLVQGAVFFKEVLVVAHNSVIQPTVPLRELLFERKEAHVIGVMVSMKDHLDLTVKEVTKSSASMGLRGA